MGFFGSWLGERPRWVQLAVFGAIIGVLAYAFIASGAWWGLLILGLLAGAIYVRIRDG
jgi:hypothetical protein